MGKIELWLKEIIPNYFICLFKIKLLNWSGQYHQWPEESRTKMLAKYLICRSCSAHVCCNLFCHSNKVKKKQLLYECDMVSFPFRGIIIMTRFTRPYCLTDVPGCWLPDSSWKKNRSNKIWYLRLTGIFCLQLISRKMTLFALFTSAFLFLCTCLLTWENALTSSSSFRLVAIFWLILSLPKQKKQDSKPDGTMKPSEDELTCSICLEQVNMGELIRSLPCLHQVATFLYISMINMALKREAIVHQISLSLSL